ncbi:MAG: hypothetical protein NZM04_11150 [Methylacidiphilales bacterium]|nr:hypothetical protein [Candidatus Methylacidiphilales bacterium]
MSKPEHYFEKHAQRMTPRAKRSAFQHVQRSGFRGSAPESRQETAWQGDVAVPLD